MRLALAFGSRGEWSGGRGLLTLANKIRSDVYIGMFALECLLFVHSRLAEVRSSAQDQSQRGPIQAGQNGSKLVTVRPETTTSRSPPFPFPPLPSPQRSSLYFLQWRCAIQLGLLNTVITYSRIANVRPIMC